METNQILIRCTNLNCGFTWSTVNKKRNQKCFKCNSKGTSNTNFNEIKSKPNVEQKPSPKEIREEKLAKLNKRLEADNDKDNFRLSTRERKSINQKIRDLLSVKIYAEYNCHQCSISWTSVHGWTNFTQKCIHCMQLAECLGQVELSEEEIQAKLHRSVKRMIGFSRGDGGVFGHDPRRCQMCAIIISNGTDINCMKRKWVRLVQEGSTYRVLEAR